MVMADAYEWPAEIKFPLTRNEGLGLDCFICRKMGADMTFTFRIGCERRWIGVHAECAKAAGQ